MKNFFCAWLVVMGLLAPSFAPVLAQSAPQPGTLIKGSGTAVYWYSSVDNRRHLFPNMKTFFTWFSPYDFDRVHTVSDGELTAITMGDNITYRPAVRLLKLETDPKIYAVESGRVVRWIASESLAASLYGPHWQQYIDDVPDAFFINYTIGAPIRTRASYAPVAALTPEDSLR